MSTSPAYRRTWRATARLLAALLLVVGVVTTPLDRWPTLVAVLVAAGIAGAVWVMTGPAPTCPHEVRRAAAFSSVGILAAVGAGHLGPAALLAVVALVATSPWVRTALGRRPAP